MNNPNKQERLAPEGDFHLSAEVRQRLQHWATPRGLSLSEAVRRLILTATSPEPELGAGGSPGRRLQLHRAQEAAATSIDDMQRGVPLSESEKAGRKSRLLYGPKEFRNPVQPGTATPSRWKLEHTVVSPCE